MFYIYRLLFDFLFAFSEWQFVSDDNFVASVLRKGSITLSKDSE